MGLPGFGPGPGFLVDAPTWGQPLRSDDYSSIAPLSSNTSMMEDEVKWASMLARTQSNMGCVDLAGAEDPTVLPAFDTNMDLLRLDSYSINELLGEYGPPGGAITSDSSTDLSAHGVEFPRRLESIDRMGSLGTTLWATRHSKSPDIPLVEERVTDFHHGHRKGDLKTLEAIIALGKGAPQPDDTRPTRGFDLPDHNSLQALQPPKVLTRSLSPQPPSLRSRGVGHQRRSSWSSQSFDNLSQSPPQARVPADTHSPARGLSPTRMSPPLSPRKRQWRDAGLPEGDLGTVGGPLTHPATAVQVLQQHTGPALMAKPSLEEMQMVYRPLGKAAEHSNRRESHSHLKALSSKSEPQMKTRQKRGTATDPQSVAARMRRDKIAQRMRTIQAMVPSINGKQLDTATMLDEAIAYFRSLQEQVDALRKKPQGNGASWSGDAEDGASHHSAARQASGGAEEEQSGGSHKPVDEGTGTSPSRSTWDDGDEFDGLNDL
eukprot:SM000214S06798  [mRNA]  locus=s214:124494:127439:- [translate_table: standard]